MEWCTPADLLAAESDTDLIAELAAPTDQPPVSGALLRLAVAGGAIGGEQEEAAAGALARLVRACAEGGDQVDAHLASRWPGGLSPVPAIVRSAAVGLALEDLLGARTAAPDGPYSGIIRRAKTARATLVALRDGTLTLGTASVSTPATVRYQAADRLLTADTLAGMG
ncbi:phage protein Gp36 family protein [uncultured Thiodictyon sp.]|uniref:phage protein Gp36 family protein n=1 Tax=uncultured Thiodictyon sp. TaxID=1846217 RepID=UPI0025EEFBA1|nr:phage protein Gp36 family protein [uncultured Thiodictyon sp.]